MTSDLGGGSSSRRLGFLEYQDTERSFLDLFDQLRQERVIPSWVRHSELGGPLHPS